MEILIYSIFDLHVLYDKLRSLDSSDVNIVNCESDAAGIYIIRH